MTVRQIKILEEYPPNYDKIARTFNLEGKKPCFTYGETIYNPHKGIISEDILAHEAVHVKQQEIIGIEKWWEIYLEDQAFRLQQELEAYRVQYKHLIENNNRQYQRIRIRQITKDLSSAMYGNLLTKEEAIKKIKEE